MVIDKAFLEAKMDELEKAKQENERVVWRFEGGILILKMLLEELAKGATDDSPSNPEVS